jgi:hypothetical protein
MHFWVLNNRRGKEVENPKNSGRYACLEAHGQHIALHSDQRENSVILHIPIFHTIFVRNIVAASGHSGDLSCAGQVGPRHRQAQRGGAC